MPAAPAAITDPKDETGQIRLPVAKLCILNSVLSLEPPGPDWAALKPNPSEHEVFTAIPDVISRSAGAGRIDAFTLRVNLGKNETRAHDYLRLSGFNEQWEIRALDYDGEPSVLLAWGIAVQDTVDMGERSESVHTTCRLDDNLFGIPLTSYPILDPVTHEERSIELPLVWNPEREVNGTPIIEPNLITWSESVGSGVVTRYYVQDPDSRRTDASTTFQETTGGGFTLPSASLATLAEVAFLLCTRLNAAETWIENPADVGEISAQLGTIGLDQTILKNQRQTYGNYLPKALDELLTPHGCGWYLEHSLIEDPDFEPPESDPDALPWKIRVSTIKFYRRGEGMKVSLRRAASGVKTKQNTNVNHLRAQVSLIDMANVVQVYGDYERREATFELKKAWPAADDALHAADLAIGGAQYTAHPFAGRKWVFDTAGDYINLRTGYDEPDDLAQYFDPAEWVDDLTYKVGETVFMGDVFFLCLADNIDSEPTSSGTPPASTNSNWQVIDDPSNSLAYRRRVFLPCLSEKTQGDDGVSNRYVLEWFNPNAGIAASAWNATVQYYIGQTVSHSGTVYVATADNLNSTPPSGNWQSVGAVSPAAWSIGTSYTTNDEVTYNSLRYRAKRSTVGDVPSTSTDDWESIEAQYFGGDWVRYKSGFSVLQHECGILFETPEIPGELWRLLQQDPPTDRLRITCSIDGDRRVQGRALRRSSSPNEQDVVMTLEMPDKFQDARICRGSKFYGTANQHCRNDTAKILTYAQTIQEIEDCADYSFSVVIEAMLHPELEIGMLVESIDGVDITMDANARAIGRTPRYPQIVGLNYMTQMPQMCEVMLENFKMEHPEVTA